MLKRTIVAVVAVFITYSILDFVIHGLLLQSTYEATAKLWRPMEEMNMLLMYFVTFVYTTCFVLIYAFFVAEKSLLSGVKYGGLFGLAVGMSMGFGTYTFMPIPLSLAWSWFAGTLFELIVTGALAGVLLKPAGKSA